MISWNVVVFFEDKFLVLIILSAVVWVVVFQVYCDHKTNGGGWTVLQKRQDGSVDFYRGWDDYKRGQFGNLKGEFWLGLDNIYRLSKQSQNRLRVELEDFSGNSAYAEYDYFSISSERTMQVQIESWYLFR